MDNFTQIQFYTFATIIVTLYILNGVLLIGFFPNAKKYIEDIDFYLKIYISLYIIYRFNRFRKVVFSELDRMVIFTSGIFLFATTIIHKLLINYLEEIQIWISKRKLI